MPKGKKRKKERKEEMAKYTIPKPGPAKKEFSLNGMDLSPLKDPQSGPKHLTTPSGIPIAVFGEAEERTVAQIARCAEAGEAEAAALMADNHVGYSQPIGGVVAYENYISPSGIGFDISCGIRATKTDIKASDIDISKVMDEIERRINFGVGGKNENPVDHPVLEKIHKFHFEPVRKLYQTAKVQLSSVGSGNHFTNVMEDTEDGSVWVMVHFGSRGFGHTIASNFMAMAQGYKWGEKFSEGGMDAPPILIPIDSDLGQVYIESMELAGEYAYAGRELVVEEILKILGAQEVETIHNHHNFAWRETINGKALWVVRKGATPAFPGQKGAVGASMGEESVVVEGKEHDYAADALYSTVHGAGRVMSRTQAAGKLRWIKVFSCGDRDCNYQTEGKKGGKPRCPDHPKARMHTRRVQVVTKPGRVDWEKVKKSLKAQGIEIRGGGADEAPEVYKRLTEVLNAHEGLVEVRHRFKPLGVAMAGADVYDPYKD